MVPIVYRSGPNGTPHGGLLIKSKPLEILSVGADMDMQIIRAGYPDIMWSVAMSKANSEVMYELGDVGYSADTPRLEIGHWVEPDRDELMGRRFVIWNKRPYMLMGDSAAPLFVYYSDVLSCHRWAQLQSFTTGAYVTYNGGGTPLPKKVLVNEQGRMLIPLIPLLNKVKKSMGTALRRRKP